LQESAPVHFLILQRARRDVGLYTTRCSQGNTIRQLDVASWHLSECLSRLIMSARWAKADIP
jgi:hypothetical protein